LFIESLKTQKDEIDGNYANLTILRVKYLDLCVSMVKDFEPRLKYWLERK
jgi:hypothetical protein